MLETKEIAVHPPMSLSGGANGSTASYKYVTKKLDDAERLLAYAAKKGIEIATDARDDILHARTIAPAKWTKEIATNVLVALAALAAKLKPIKTIKKYEVLVIVLAFFIIPFSVVTFITSGISKTINTDIQKANE